MHVVYSDVSGTVFGRYTVKHGGEVAHDHWHPMEAQQSSMWCELRAVRLVLESRMNKLQNCTVK